MGAAVDRSFSLVRMEMIFRYKALIYSAKKEY